MIISPLFLESVLELFQIFSSVDNVSGKSKPFSWHSPPPTWSKPLSSLAYFKIASGLFSASPWPCATPGSIIPPWTDHFTSVNNCLMVSHLSGSKDKVLTRAWRPGAPTISDLVSCPPPGSLFHALCWPACFWNTPDFFTLELLLTLLLLPALLFFQIWQGFFPHLSGLWSNAAFSKGPSL